MNKVEISYYYQSHFKIVRLPSGLKLLPIVPQIDTRQCAGENVGSLRGWIVRFYIGWRVEPRPSRHVLKPRY